MLQRAVRSCAFGARIGHQLDVGGIIVVSLGHFNCVSSLLHLRPEHRELILHQPGRRRHLRRLRALRPSHAVQTLSLISLDGGQQISFFVGNVNLQVAEDVALLLVIDDAGRFGQGAPLEFRVAIESLLARCQRQQRRTRGQHHEIFGKDLGRERADLAPERELAYPALPSIAEHI